MEQKNNSLDQTAQGTLDGTVQQNPLSVITSTTGSGFGHRRISPFHYNRLASAITSIAILIVVAISLLAYFLISSSHSKPDEVVSKADKYSVSSLPVNNLKTNSQLKVGEVDHLTVNGQLRVSKTLVITPTAMPDSPVTGQIYFDKSTNTPFYYNGTKFIPVTTSIGGITGAVNVGGGLSLVNSTLVNSGVISVQGQTGAVNFASGNGIAINGSTITNTGLLGISGNPNQLAINSSGDGTVQVQIIGIQDGGVLIGKSNGGIDTVLPSSPGQCLISDPSNSKPVFGSCTGSTTVTSITIAGTPLTDNLVIQGAGGIGVTHSGQTITIDGTSIAPGGDVSFGATHTNGHVTSLDSNGDLVSSPLIDQATGLQVQAGSYYVDLANGGASTLTIKNSNGSNVANLTVTGVVQANGGIRDSNGNLYSFATSPTGSSRTLCYVDNLNASNCPIGGDVSKVGTPTNNKLSKFNSSGNIQDSSLLDQTTGLQVTGSSYYLDLANSGSSTFTVKNSNGSNVANLQVTGNIGAAGFVQGTDLYTLPTNGGNGGVICYIYNGGSNCPTGGNVSFGTTHTAGHVTALDGSGNLISTDLINQSGGLQVTGNAYYLDVANAGSSTLTVKNTTAGQVANLAVTGAINAASSITAGGGLVAHTLSDSSGSDLQITSTGNNIVFSINGGSSMFTFPTSLSDGSTQTICTTGVTCAAGGGQAVLLDPGAAQTSMGGASSVFINRSSGSGNIIQLQAGGSDAFVIDSTGAASMPLASGLTLGKASTNTGKLAFKASGNTNTVNLTVGNSTAGYTLTLPTAAGTSGQCLSTTGGGVLTFSNCLSGGGGNGVTAITDGTNSASGTVTFTSGDSSVNFTVTGSSVDFSVPAGATGVTSIGALDGVTKDAKGAAISGSTLYLQTADTSFAGLIGTGAQTFAGNKSFNGNTALNGSATLTVGTGLTTLGGGLSVTAGNILQTGTGTFATGTGAISLNGSSTITNGSLTVGNGANAGSLGIVSAGTGQTVTITAVNRANALALSIPGALGSETTDTICLQTRGNCAAGGGQFIVNGTSQQTSANFNIQSVAGQVAAKVQGASGQDIIDFYSSASSSVPVAKIDSTGSITAVGGTFTGNLSQTGTGTFGTGTGNVSLNGNTSVTNANTFTVGNGQTTLGGGLAVTSGNILQSGSGTFGTGTGNVSLNGSTTVANGNFIVGNGANAGSLGIVSAASGQTVTISAANRANALALSIPAAAGSETTDTICLQTRGNCAAGGGQFIVNGTSQQTTANFNIQSVSGQVAAKVQGASGQDIVDFYGSASSSVALAKIDSTGSITAVGATFTGNFSQTGTGTFATSTGAISLNGSTTITNGNLIVGNGTSAGNLGIVSAGSGQTITITAVNRTNALALSIPAAAGSETTDTICLQTRGNCAATGGQFIVNGYASQQTSANFNIQSVSGQVAAKIQGASGQDIIDFYASGSSSVTVAKIDSTGSITAVGATFTGNFSQTGTGTFGTGTGNVSLNGTTAVTNGNLTVGSGANAGSLVLVSVGSGQNVTINALNRTNALALSIPGALGSETTDTICLQTRANCTNNGSGGSNFIVNGTSQQTSANFNIQSTAGQVAAKIQGASGQDIIDFYSSASSSVSVASIDSTGLLIANKGLTSNGAAINLNDSSNFNTNINTGTSTGAVTIGNTTGASSIALRVGTGNFTLDGAASSTYAIGASATTGTLTLGGTAQTGNLTVGQSTLSNSINIGNATIANGNTGTINIGTSATGATGKTVLSIGSTNAASSVLLQSGTAGTSLTSSGAINLTAGAASTITSGAGTLTLQGGNGTGANNSGTALVLNGGQGTGTASGGNINLQIAKPSGSSGSSSNSLTTVATISGTNGSATFKNATDSTTAFQVQNAAGSQLFSVDTSGMKVDLYSGLVLHGIGTPSPSLTGASTGGTLAAGTYYYRVAAYNANSISGAINTSPTSRTTTGSTSQNTISWSAVTGATGYYIYRATTANGPYYRVDVGNVTSAIDNSTNYTFSGTDYTGDIGYNGTASITLAQGGGLYLDPAGNGSIFENSAGNYVNIGAYGAGQGVVVQGDSFSFQNTNDYLSNFTINNTGATTFRNRTNSTTAFQIQNAAGSSVFNVDTTNGVIGTALTAAVSTNSNALVIRSGNATGATSNSGNVTLDSGTATGTAGSVSIGTGAYAHNTTIGNTSGTSAVNLQGGSGGVNVTSGALTLGVAGTTTGSLVFGTSASNSRTVTLQSANPAAGSGNVVITIPATLSSGSTDTICLMTLANCSGATLQATYTASTGGTTPEVILDTSRGGIDIQNNNSTPVVGSLFAVRDKAASGLGTTLFNVTDTGTTTMQNTAGIALFTADTANMRVSIGSKGTATSQLYVGGVTPSGALGSANGANASYGLALQGRYAYTTPTAATNGFQVYDVSNPASPSLLASANTTSSANKRVKVQGKYAYVAGGGTFQVFDISNPKLPTSVGSLSYTSGANTPALYVQGRYAYVGDSGTPTLYAFDISNPALPTLAGSVAVATSSNGPADIYVQGRYGYIVNGGTNRFQVVDFSNPGSPSLVATVTNSTITTVPMSIVVQGRYAYIGTSVGSIYVFDVSLAGTPASITSVSLSGGSTHSLDAQGRYLYAGDATNGLINTLDISNPASPSLISGTTTAVSPLELVAGGRYLYAANNNATGTLQSFDMGGAYTQQLEAGGIETDTLSARGNANFASDVAIQGSLGLGGGLQVGGNSGFSGAVGIQTTQANALQVKSGAGTSVINADSSSGVFSVGGNVYSTGTITQSGTSITGSGTTFTTAMTGGTIYYQDGTSSIITYVSATSLTSSISKTVAAGSSYSISYGGYRTSTSGATTIQTTTNSTTAFQIQNSSAQSLFNVDTTNSVITIGSSNNGATSAWTSQSTNLMPQARDSHGVATYNGYIYIVGGDKNNTIASTVMYAKVNADGSTGAWGCQGQTSNSSLGTYCGATAVNGNTLPAARSDLSVIAYGGYLYTFGGYDGTTYYNSVYVAKINADGSTGAWIDKTGTYGLPLALSDMGTSVYNGYVYLIGGHPISGSGNADAYSAKLGPNGTLSSWTTYSGWIAGGANRRDLGAVVANGYIYALAGDNGASNLNIYYGKLNADGTLPISSTTASTSLNTGQTGGSVYVMNGYIYVVGYYNSGIGGGRIVQFAKLNTDGSLGTWSCQGPNSAACGGSVTPVNNNILPIERSWFGLTGLTINGYMYVIGGTNGSGSNFSTTSIYYTSTQRLQVNGSLDLVGGNATSFTDGGTTSGSSGGSLTAGNTRILGTLDVQGSTYFAADVTIGGALNVMGDATLNSNLAVLGNTTLSGTLTVTGAATFNGHILTGNATGTTSGAVNANAGSGGSPACTVTGNDTSGQITLTTGTASWVSGIQCTISFAQNYTGATPPRPVIASANSANISLVNPYVDVPGSSPYSTWTLNFGAADTAQHTFKFNYFNAQ